MKNRKWTQYVAMGVALLMACLLYTSDAADD